MKVKVRFSKFECRKDISFKTQLGSVAKNATPRSPAWNLFNSIQIYFAQIYRLQSLERRRYKHNYSEIRKKSQDKL